jgi:hypothetical protein
MVSRIATFTLSSLLGLCVASGAMAENKPGHPRINEVNHRVTMQEHRIDRNLDHGDINRWQARRDERRDERVERQLHHDEAMHDGHITWAEQHHLNQELDRNTIHIDSQSH